MFQCIVCLSGSSLALGRKEIKKKPMDLFLPQNNVCITKRSTMILV